MKKTIIDLRKLGFEADGQQILHDISLSIGAGEIVTIIGPNGAGKSTLIKILAGLKQRTSGQIESHGKLRLGYVPQKLHIDSSLPMKVSRFLSLAKIDREARREALQTLEISHLANHQLHHLSGGELQRVLLARAIARNPDLLLLDEPLQGIDVNGQIELYRLISQLREAIGCAIVMVSHDLHLVMAQTDSVVCLNHHICCQGVAESVSQHPEYLKLFSDKAAQEIAVYSHHHDHHHTIHGDVAHCNSECDHD